MVLSRPFWKGFTPLTLHEDILCHGSSGAEDKGSVLSSESDVVIGHKAFGSERSDTWLAWAQFEKTEHHLPSAKKLKHLMNQDYKTHI